MLYLIHVPVLTTIANNTQTAGYWNDWLGYRDWLVVVVLSYALACLVSMMVESPTMGLEKILLGNRGRSAPKPEETVKGK
jgi:peptidoglycan/LPS O-acetylase OafA/YrhL